MYTSVGNNKQQFLSGIALVLLVICFGSVFISSGTQAQGYEPAFETVDCWFDTPESVPTDCGYLIVPEDRSKPDGNTVRLATVIFRATGNNPEPDPIIQLHGGPGGGPVPSFQFGEYEGYAALTETNRDVLVFDQRGNGYSEPSLMCPEFAAANIDILDLEVNDMQITHTEAQQIVVDAALACEARLSESVDLSMYTTLESAHDTNDLRVALGYDQVNLHGESYGTRLAQVVALEYPNTIRSIVFDAVEGPDDAYDVWPNALGNAINQAIDNCAANEACNAAYPNLHDVLLDTVKRLDEEPVHITAKHILTGDEFPILLDDVTFETVLWRFNYSTAQISLLPQMIYDVNQGNYDIVKSIWGKTFIAMEFNAWGSFFSVNCNDQLPFSDLNQFQLNAESHPEVKDFFLDGTILGSYLFPLCEAWDSGISSNSMDGQFVIDTPTLVLGTKTDPATPISSTQDIMNNLSNGYGPYIFPQMGHVVSLGGHECPANITMNFISDPTTAPDGSCIDDMTIEFNIPGEADEIVLEQFTNEEAGFSTIVPTGWNELLPGVYARTNPAADPTILGQMAFPTAGRDVAVAEILTQLGAGELPADPIRSMDSETLSWSMYLISGENVVMIALADSGEMSYMVLLQGTSEEFDELAEQLLVPALMDFTPVQ